MLFSNWLSWMKTGSGRAVRARRGFARQASLHSRRSLATARFAEPELLEDRTLLAAFNVSGSTLQLDLAASEAVVITSAGSTYAFALTGGTWSGTDGAGATGNGLATLTATAAALSEVKVDDSGTGVGVNFADSGANTYTSSFTVTLDSASPAGSTLSGTTAFTGSAALFVQAGSIATSLGAKVSTVDGNLTLRGNMLMPGRSGNFNGVNIADSQVKVTGTGNLTIQGRSGISSTTQMGVRIQSGSVITGGTAGSTLTIEGYGATTSTATNYGVDFRDSGSSVTTLGGSVVIIGTGGGGGTNNKGVTLEAGTSVFATGNGSISVTGTGGTNNSQNAGVELLTGTQITSANGIVTVIGTGGGGNGGSSVNRGVIVSGSIQSTGSGDVSVTGTGGIGTGSANDGVLMERNGSGTVQEIKSGTGNVTVTGTAGGGSSLGINVNSLAAAAASITTGAPGGISLIADSMRFATSSVINAPTVTVKPKTAAMNMDLGSASDSTANTLELSQAELNTITTTTLNLGDVNTAIINVSANITLPDGTTTNLTAAGINLNGNTISGGTVNQTTSNKPLIALEQPAGTAIAKGATANFGSVAVGSTADFVFTVKNPGSADLTGLGITIDGTNADEFSLVASPVTPVTAGGSTTFTIRHAPTSGGNKTAAFHLSSNAFGVPVFDVNLTASSLPGIAVQQQAGAAVADGGSAAFGTVVTGSTADMVFTIQNPGFADLTGLGITIDGAHAGDFSVFASPTAPVPAGGSATFTIRFTAGSPGPRTAALHIASNVAGALNPYDINLSALCSTGLLFSGVKSVGPTGEYPSLNAALLTMQNSTFSGPVVLELQAGYSSASETFPLVFSNLLTTATNTLTVRPAAGATGLVISSADTTAATVDLNGAQFVTFDGRPGGVGTAKELTIENTDTAGVALRFINEASNNTLKFVTLKGVNTSAASGTVVFSTTTGANGNDNNTLDTCDIRDGATTPRNGLYSLGSTTTNAQANSGNTVTNCNVFNFVAATNSDAAGVRLEGGNTDWTISGSSFYQTATRSAALANVRAIYINNTSGNNFTVTGNFIGGSASNCGGTAWTTTGTSVVNRFVGIQLAVGATTASSVQGNTIANIAWTTNSAGTTPGNGPLHGIYLSAGNVNIGTVTGNTIGSGTGTGSISVTTSISGGTSWGISSASSGTVAIANNTIGSITTNGSASTISASLVGIQVTAGANTISNNTVGSTTTANSLNAATSSTSTTGQQVTGILSTSSGGASITGNTVANLNNNYASTATSGQIRGIVTSAGVNTITGNTVRNLSTTSQNAMTGLTASTGQSVVGIGAISTAAGQTVSQNTVHSLANTAASAAVVTGIYFAGPTSGTNVIARNFVHSLAVSSTSASSALNGMTFLTGTFTAQNNLVRVGLNADGTSTAGASTVRGIFDNGTTAGRNFYHNSVYVGGTQTQTPTGSATYAFQSGGSTNSRTFQNNVFVNARSNSGGTGKHYAVNYGGTTVNPTGLTASNNLFFVSGTGGVLGLYNSADRTTLADWQTATGVDANSLNTDPLFVLPTGTAATVDLHLQSTSPALGAGLALAAVTNDFDGDLRPLTTPDIGADELGVSNAAPVFTSSATPSVPENTLDVVALTATDADLDTVTFSITGGADSGKFEIVDVSGSPVLKFKTATTPNFEQPGSAAGSNTFLVTVTANDGQGHTPSQNLTVTVTNTNEPPTLANAILDENATTDAAFSFQFAADAFADVDAGDSLTYSATLADGSALPGWLSFDAATRTFSGTPSTGDVGTLSVKVTATDTSSASASDTFDIAVVSLNVAPEFTSSNMPSVAENMAAVVALTATDADNDAVSFSITGGADSAKFEIADVNGVPTLQFLPNPLAALIFQQTGVLIDPYADFENPGSAAGSNTYLVTVTADDGHGHMISQDLAVTVTDVNEKPKLLLATNSFNVPENTTAVTTVSAFDPDANTTLSYSLSGANAGSFSVSSSGEITFKFAPNFESDQTSYTFNVTVSDGELSDTQTITVSVNDVNDPPVIEAPSVSRQQGSPVSRSAIAYVYDDDGGDGDITVTVTSANPSNGVTISNIVNTDGIITADVIASSTATNASFTLQASDGVLTSTTTVNVTVTANTPPTLGYAPRAFANKTVLDGLSGNQVNAIVVAGNTIYVGTGSSSNNGGLSISTDGGRTFVNKTTANGLGANTVNDISVNGNTVVVSHRFTGVLGYSISTDGGATFTYINGGSFFYSIAESGGTIYGGSNGVGIKITSDGGDNFVTRTTADGLGDGQVRDLFVTGNTIYAGTAGGLSISTDGGTTFVNRTTADGLGNNFVEGVFVVGNTVYAATFGGLSISTDGGATFTNKTTADGLGDNWVHKVFATGNTVIAATNGGLSISMDGGATFTNKTTADGLGNNVVNAVAAASGVLFAGTTAGLSFGTGAPPSDPVTTLGDSLTVNPTSGPVDNGSISTIAVQSAGTYTGTISVDPATGVVSFSNAGPVGTHTIAIRATDNSGATTDASFTVTVNPPLNSAPTLANSIPDQQASENNAFSFQFAADTFADVDVGDSLSYSTSTLPTWLSFNASTRTLSGTPATSDVGFVDVTVTATDSSNEQVSDTFRITVAYANNFAPVLADATFSVAENAANGTSVGTVAATDADSTKTLSYSITAGNGLGTFAINSSTGEITVADNTNLESDDNFPFQLAVQVSDGGPGTSQTDTALVTINKQPTALVVNLGGSQKVVVQSHNGHVQVIINDVVASEFSSILTATLRSITINGGSGNNLLDLRNVTSATFPRAGGLTVVVQAGAGNDTVLGSSFGDQISGGAGDDSLDGGLGNDILDGGLNNDTVIGGVGNDTLAGGDGAADVLSAVTTSNLTLSPTQLTMGVSSITEIDTLSGFEKALLLGSGTANVMDASAATIPVTLYGGGGNDVLIGGTAADYIDGQAGNDTLTGSGGNDALFGGAGADGFREVAYTDVVAGQTRNITLTSTSFVVAQGAETLSQDSLSGFEFAEITAGSMRNSIDASAFTTTGVTTITGGGSADTIIGSDGNDIIYSLAGADIINGNGGDDSIFAGSGNDKVTGGPGADTLNGQNGNDSLVGDEGDDALVGGADIDTLLGGSGNDFLSGQTEAGLLYGGEGNDIIQGNTANDTLYGEAGDDRLFGLQGDDVIYGGDGADSLVGAIGNDSLHGDTGVDTLRGAVGNDLLDGGADFDRINEEFDADVTIVGITVTAVSLGSDSVLAIERIQVSGGAGNNLFDARQAAVPVFLSGGAGNDTLLGGSKGDGFNGGDGDDVISGGAGKDLIDGGNGTDYVYEKADTNFTVNGVTISSTLTGTDDAPTNIERIVLIGGAGANKLDATLASLPVVLIGGRGNDTLLGGSASDTISGGNRNDATVVSGDGTDSLDGGVGFDVLENDSADTKVIGAGDITVADVFMLLPSWIDSL